MRLAEERGCAFGTKCDEASFIRGGEHMNEIDRSTRRTQQESAFDHIINGEIVPFWPFFTALNEDGGVSTMLSEMLTVGVPMSIVVTAIYAAMCLKPSWKH